LSNPNGLLVGNAGARQQERLVDAVNADIRIEHDFHLNDRFRTVSWDAPGKIPGFGGDRSTNPL
jgi:hypothetical protein